MTNKLMTDDAFQAAMETYDADIAASQGDQDALIEKSWKDPESPVNLTPFFSEPVDSPYWLDGDCFNSLCDFTFADQGDGWMRFTKANSHGTRPLWLKVPAIPGLKQGEVYTLLAEVKRSQCRSSNGTYHLFASDATYDGVEHSGQMSASTESPVPSFPILDSNTYGSWIGGGGSGTYRFEMTVTDPDADNLAVLVIRSTFYEVDIYSCFDLRLSLYEGSYTGNYIPFEHYTPLWAKRKLDLLPVYETKMGCERGQAEQDVLINAAWKEINLLPLSTYSTLKTLNSLSGWAPYTEDKASLTVLEDGWVRIAVSDNYEKIGIVTEFTSDVLEIEEGEKFSAIVEWRNGSSNQTFIADFNSFGTWENNRLPSTSYQELGFIIDTGNTKTSGCRRFELTAGSNAGDKSVNVMRLAVYNNYDNGDMTIDIRLSLVRGGVADGCFHKAPDRFYPYEDSPSDIKSRMLATEAKQALHDEEIALSWREHGPNLAPFFSEQLNSPYWADGTDFRLDSNRISYTNLDDGWLHVEKGTGINRNIYVVIPAIPGVKVGDKFTILMEVRNSTATVGNCNAGIGLHRTDSSPGYVQADDIDHNYYPVCDVNGVDDYSQAITVEVFETEAAGFCEFVIGATGRNNVASWDIRLSLYKGIYTGPYVPFDYDTPLGAKLRIADLETSQATQDTEIAKSWKTEDQKPENLTPFFSMPFDDGDYWDLVNVFTPERMEATQLENGWARFTITEGTSGPAYDFNLKDNFQFLFSENESFTFLIEFDNVVGATDDNDVITVNLDTTVSTLVDDNNVGINIASSAQSKTAVRLVFEPAFLNAVDYRKRLNGITLLYFFITALGETTITSFDMRVSLYRESDGVTVNSDYVPYDTRLQSHYTHMSNMLFDKFRDFNYKTSVTFHDNRSHAPGWENADDPTEKVITVPYNFPSGILLTYNYGLRNLYGVNLTSWNTKADGSGTSYQVGELFQSEGQLNVDLYAQWTAAS